MGKELVIEYRTAKGHRFVLDRAGDVAHEVIVACLAVPDRLYLDAQADALGKMAIRLQTPVLQWKHIDTYQKEACMEAWAANCLLHKNF